MTTCAVSVIRLHVHVVVAADAHLMVGGLEVRDLANANGSHFLVMAGGARRRIGNVIVGDIVMAGLADGILMESGGQLVVSHAIEHSLINLTMRQDRRLILVGEYANSHLLGDRIGIDGGRHLAAVEEDGEGGGIGLFHLGGSATVADRAGVLDVKLQIGMTTSAVFVISHNTGMATNAGSGRGNVVSCGIGAEAIASEGSRLTGLVLLNLHAVANATFSSSFVKLVVKGHRLDGGFRSGRLACTSMFRLFAKHNGIGLATEQAETIGGRNFGLSFSTMAVIAIDRELQHLSIGAAIGHSIEVTGHAGIMSDGSELAGITGVTLEEAESIFGILGIVGLAIRVIRDVAGPTVFHSGGNHLERQDWLNVLGVDMGCMKCSTKIHRHTLFFLGIGNVAGTARGCIGSLAVLVMTLKAGLVPSVLEAILIIGCLNHGEGLHTLNVLAQSGMANSTVVALFQDFGHMSFMVEKCSGHFCLTRMLHHNTHDPGVASRNFYGLCGITERNDTDKAGHHCYTAGERVSSLVHRESFQ